MNKVEVSCDISRLDVPSCKPLRLNKKTFTDPRLAQQPIHRIVTRDFGANPLLRKVASRIRLRRANAPGVFLIGVIVFQGSDNSIFHYALKAAMLSSSRIPRSHINARYVRRNYPPVISNLFISNLQPNFRFTHKPGLCPP